MIQQTIFIFGLIATTISAQNALPNEIPKIYPPPVQPNITASAQDFTLEALMQISRGTEKFSLELYKVTTVAFLKILKFKNF